MCFVGPFLLRPFLLSLCAFSLPRALSAIQFQGPLLRSVARQYYTLQPFRSLKQQVQFELRSLRRSSSADVSVRGSSDRENLETQKPPPISVWIRGFQ